MSGAAIAIRLLIIVPLGLVLAFVTGFGVAVIAVLQAWPDLRDPYTGIPDPELFGTAAAALFVGGPIVFTAALVLALLAELMAVRSWIFYAGVGAVLSLAVGRLLELVGDGQLVTDFMGIGAGLAAGLVYWIVAGRSAGFGGGSQKHA